MPVAQVGNPRPHPDDGPGTHDQPFGREYAQMHWLAERPSGVRCGDEPEKVGDGSGPDHGRPEPTHCRVRGVVARSGVVEGHRSYETPWYGRWSERGRRGARGWRGFHLDGRTGISTEEPGHRDGHG